jgi:hypothetical protein
MNYHNVETNLAKTMQNQKKTFAAKNAFTTAATVTYVPNRIDASAEIKAIKNAQKQSNKNKNNAEQYAAQVRKTKNLNQLKAEAAEKDAQTKKNNWATLKAKFENPTSNIPRTVTSNIPRTVTSNIPRSITSNIPKHVTSNSKRNTNLTPIPSRRPRLLIQQQTSDDLHDFFEWVKGYEGDTPSFTDEEKALIDSLYRRYKSNERITDPSELNLLKSIKDKLSNLEDIVTQWSNKEHPAISVVGKAVLIAEIKSVLLQMSSTRGGAKTKYHKRIISKRRQTKKR